MVDVRIEHTILIKRRDDDRGQHATPSDKLIDRLCCVKLRRHRVHPCADRRQKATNKVRFREPNQVEPIRKRQPSWSNYDNWTRQALEDALDDFIRLTLVRVIHTMVTAGRNDMSEPM